MNKIVVEVNDQQMNRFRAACKVFKTPPTIQQFMHSAIERGLYRLEQEVGFERGRQANERKDRDRTFPIPLKEATP